MSLQLSLLPEEFAVCRFPREAAVPHWVTAGELYCVTRTADELSLVCPVRELPGELPPSAKVTAGWRALKLHGPFAFEETGVLASILSPLAGAGVSIFALSTYDTDYVLVRAGQMERAIAALTSSGHAINR